MKKTKRPNLIRKMYRITAEMEKKIRKIASKSRCSESQALRNIIHFYQDDSPIKKNK